ncbi:MAG: SWIM zinc finger family protein [Phycisphaeraceae bacterium]|nr:SWIM zinc finger family protein [Phycisphaeraceae bacterium]
MSWVKAWATYFDGPRRMRGREYQQEGRVHRVAPSNGELVRAEVRGTRTYVVTIHPGDEGAELRCTCPSYQAGVLCKHIWATLLELQEHPAGPNGEFSRVDAVPARMPKARRKSRDEPSRTTARESAWVGRLTMLLPPGELIATAMPALVQRQLVYVILPEESEQYNQLGVELRQRQPTRQGWSRPKPVRLSSSELTQWPEEIDRELAALLFGGRPLERELPPWQRTTNESSRACFCLPAGGWRMMLKRMIDSGRCCVTDDRDHLAVLRWDGGVADPATFPEAASEQVDEPWTLWLRGEETATGLQMNLELRRQGRSMPVDHPMLMLGGPDGVAIWDNQASSFDDRGGGPWVSQFRDARRVHGRSQPIEVTTAEIPAFLDRLYTLPQLPEIDLPEIAGREERWIRPRPSLDLLSPKGRPDGQPDGKMALSARVWFAYGQRRVSPVDPGRFVTDVGLTPADPAAGEEALVDLDQDDAREETPVETPALEAAPEVEMGSSLIRRDHGYERRAMAMLLKLGLRQASASSLDTFLVSARQVPLVASQLLAMGWSVYADARAIRSAATPRLTIRSGIDWFELHGSVKFATEQGEQEVPLPRLLAALREGRTMIQLDDGTQGMLPHQWLEEHGLLTTLGSMQDDHLRFKSSQAAILDSLLRQQDLVHVDAAFEQARQRLRQFDGIDPIDAPATFHGTLRPYQREGLGWIRFLRDFGMGGILADDMGLGKTIQVLAMLDAWYGQADANNAKRPPTLIVAPRSVVFNWVDEAARFAPRLRVLCYSGVDRHQLREGFDRHDVIVTTYGLMRRDVDELQQFDFSYIALDEAQVIKNPASQAAKAARLLRATHRLALTGTPIENHLGDLWSIFEFLNPGMLGSGLRFGRLVRGEGDENGKKRGRRGDQPVIHLSEDDGDDTAAAQAPQESESPAQTVALQVARALRPFVLRRTKGQVLRDLPEKTEQTISCEMEAQQRQLYDELRLHYRQSLLGQTTSDAAALAGGQTFMVLEALLRLRQAACHPGLIDPKRAGEPSAKLEALTESLVELVDEGHKALVFSQFVEMLSLVRTRLDDLGVTYEYLDGQTRDRKQRVQRFQSDPTCQVFLISLKAGGLGLNLTAAEYVFILDPWWNPAVEQQAIDRAHRIGQTRPVFAYRLICRDTVEQRIAQLQTRKRALADAIVGGDESPLRNLTRDDLEELLS